MNNTLNRIAIACAMALVTAGCVQRAPYLESQMGQSLSMLKAQQTVNPDAGSNTDPVAGIDARAAKSSHDRYQQSFRAPQPQPNVFTIGIGGR
jgi:hypothetical protein